MSASSTWHSGQYLQNDHAGWWFRTTSDEMESEVNSIGPGHRDIEKSKRGRT